MSDGGHRRTEFSAADSALGYLYQCRLALVSALDRLRNGDEFCLYLETLDDVTFEQVGDPPELLQTKHRQRRSANLTDASPDLWSTLRVWCSGIASGDIPGGACFYLATTSSVPAGAAASYLGQEGRDPEKACERLRSAAHSSTSRTNQAAYTAFLALDADQQRSLVEHAHVLGSTPNILDLDAELRRELRWAVEREHFEPFLSRLEGWWLRRAIQQLCDRDASPILSEEFESQVADLRDQFRRDALPIDEDILAAEVDASQYQDAVFVEQLRLIGIGAQRLVAAIREYFRAFTQRSRWLREDLLLVGELDRYERRLVEEWELVFDRVGDELGEYVVEDLKRRAGREVYNWVEERVIPIRLNVTEPFVTRGTYQLLSDRLRVGWHPEFLERLRHLLEEGGRSVNVD